MRSCGSQMLVALGATWIIVRAVFAGLSCLSNPCIHGICLDDLNSTYSCYCIDGYTGIQCQTNWDECWSSPCRNGGICQDGIATFNCTCPDGFIGDVCDVNYDECESNPCLNDGICIDADNAYTCACQPGYSGIHCEVDIAVCNSTEGVRCRNGGLCIEGPGITFSCICTSGWTGNLCQNQIDECASSPCQNGAICLDLHADYACACVFGYTGKNCEEEIILCSENLCENYALCLVEDDFPICYCVPDYHGAKCEFQYDECQLGPRCLNGGTCIDGVDNFTCSCPPDLTGLLCECFILNDTNIDCTYIRPTSATSSELPDYSFERTKSTTITDAFITSSTYYTDFTIKSTTDRTKYPFSSTSEGYVPNTSSYDVTSTEFTTSSTFSTIPNSSFSPFYSTTPGTALSDSSTESSVTGDYFEHTTTPIEFSTIPTKSNTTEFSPGMSTSETIPREFPKTTDITDTSTYFTTTTLKDFLTGVTSTTQLSTVFTEISDLTTVAIQSTTPPDYFTVTTETLPTSDDSYLTTTISPTLTSFFTEIPTTISDFFTTTALSDTTKEFENITFQPTPDCSKSMCMNGGTCIVTVEGYKCICPFDTEGFLCEVLLGIKQAAFNGHSYLSHRLPKTTRLTIEHTAKTLSFSGILFYANIENTYMILFMQNGQLKFQFSCGFQTMLLSELEVPVNTGFEMSIKAKLDFTNDLKHCNASLKINNTLSMSGNQIAFMEHFTKGSSWLHMGGIPQQYVRDYVVTVPGFTGCMDNLKINTEKRNIFKDAQDGHQIKECSSLACLSDPCQNGATCLEHGEDWNCHCRNGYIGKMCQQSICENNPCQYGATCVPFKTSGYLCLCPLGKHGHFCENDLEIVTPSFSSSVHGLSSFSAYPVPAAISNNMELSFKFIPQTMEQISLLLFLGQQGAHDSTADHMAVSFVRGFIMLTWNLGSGPRRIFTGRPIENFDHTPHTVRLGRFGRRAWIKVDSSANITGRSPGKLVQLDVIPTVYIGGHSSANFTSLPHDLPLHTGFAGCIFDVEMRAGSLVLPILSSRFAFGRSLGQCSMMECHESSCQNGGACLQHGPTFTCLCQDGWFGPFCSLKQNPCDSTSHNCSEGSTCAPLVAGYECDCPIGKTGTFCEKSEIISDISLSGTRSYIMLSTIEFDSYKFIIEFELRPLSDRGLILFVGKFDSNSFLSVSMQGSGLEVRVSIGHHKANHHEQILVVRSDRLLAIGVWQPIRIGVSGRKVLLSVDGVVNSGTLHAGEMLPLPGSIFYIGGLSDLSFLPNGAVSTVPVPYNGCIRKFHVNEEHIPLTAQRVLEARNVADCDGTPCGGDVCKNGGTCWLDPHLKPRCSCYERYSGNNCEVQIPCAEYGCENQGRCEGSSCSCSVGWSGAYCEVAINVDIPRFFGNSYMIVDGARSTDKKRNIKALKSVNFVHLNISTANSNGIILWSIKGEEFIGVGVERGYLKFVWSFPGSDTFVVEVPAVGHISDGLWHELKISLDPANITLWVDKVLVHTQSSHVLKHDTFALTDRIFFLGGLPQNMTVTEETYGLFQSNFVGCMKPLTNEFNNSIIDFVAYNGENIGDCDVFS